jgi:Fungal Zn(2)-Cys(6) binuclear cluster domain
MDASADRTPRRTQRTPVACKPCRQNKNRCGMRSPPCARCLRVGIDCTVEPYYKRVNQRERVKQLENHVEQLRELLKKQNETPEQLPAASTGDASQSSVDALETGSRVHDESPKTKRGTGTPIEMGGFMSIEQVPSNQPRSDYAIGAVRLSEDQANNLLAW